MTYHTHYRQKEEAKKTLFKKGPGGKNSDGPKKGGAKKNSDGPKKGGTKETSDGPKKNPDAPKRKPGRPRKRTVSEDSDDDVDRYGIPKAWVRETKSSRSNTGKK